MTLEELNNLKVGDCLIKRRDDGGINSCVVVLEVDEGVQDIRTFGLYFGHYKIEDISFGKLLSENYEISEEQTTGLKEVIKLLKDNL